MLASLTSMKQRMVAMTQAIAGALSMMKETASAAVYSGTGLNTLDPIGGGVSDSTSITDLILKIINFILDFVLILAVLAVIIAGLYLLTSAGDEGQKDKAKTIITYALIGLVVILFARVIVLFVNGLID